MSKEYWVDFSCWRETANSEDEAFEKAKARLDKYLDKDGYSPLEELDIVGVSPVELEDWE